MSEPIRQSIRFFGVRCFIRSEPGFHHVQEVSSAQGRRMHCIPPILTQMTFPGQHGTSGCGFCRICCTPVNAIFDTLFESSSREQGIFPCIQSGRRRPPRRQRTAPEYGDRSPEGRNVSHRSRSGHRPQCPALYSRKNQGPGCRSPSSENQDSRRRAKQLPS